MTPVVAIVDMQLTLPNPAALLLPCPAHATLPSAAPNKCAAQPTAAVGNGTWAANCAGVGIGEECLATCAAGYTGTPRVTCLPSGLWGTVPTDTCNGACHTLGQYPKAPARVRLHNCCMLHH
jgi:hypothetical protein